MLSRKKTKNEVSKPAEVQGKYVKKETSPLLRSECRSRAGDGWGGPCEAPKLRRVLQDGLPGNARLAVPGVGGKVPRPGALLRWVRRGVPGGGRPSRATVACATELAHAEDWTP